MITQVSHSAAGTDPAGFALALEVAHELHPPLTRAPELATAAAHSSASARPTRRASARRRTVRG